MYKLHELLESTLEELAEDVAFAEQLAAMEVEPKSVIPSLTAEVAVSMLATLKLDAPSMLKKQWLRKRQFEKRLSKHWKKPLDLLEVLIAVATEAGAEFNSEFQDEAASSSDAVFRALTLLHARACQISSAILVLLRSGYADDAHARWRSLHEIAVMSFFIAKNGQGLAEKYLLHDYIERYKLASRHQEYAGRIKEEPPAQEDLNNLKLIRDALVRRFGDSFDADYGWAACAVGKERPTIGDIEQHVDLDQWRPYYRMASDNVHASAHGAYFRLGLNPHADEVLLAGPSDLGLTDPGHSTAISLNHVTIALLNTRSDFDHVVILKLLGLLVNEIGKAFLEVHHELEPSQD